MDPIEKYTLKPAFHERVFVADSAPIFFCAEHESTKRCFCTNRFTPCFHMRELPRGQKSPHGAIFVHLPVRRTRGNLPKLLQMLSK